MSEQLGGEFLDSLVYRYGDSRERYGSWRGEVGPKAAYERSQASEEAKLLRNDIASFLAAEFERGRQLGMRQEHALWKLAAEGQKMEPAARDTIRLDWLEKHTELIDRYHEVQRDCFIGPGEWNSLRTVIDDSLNFQGKSE